MSLQLALVFHFNQHTNEYAQIANRTCYRGLLNVLRAHPKLKFNLHLSGTLLRALNWFDADTLERVRAGLADGQFELLGSTYAQNVPYACHDWDNAQQIALHRAVLNELFDVEPVVFWNAERCWRQSLVELIAAGGYRTTLVEDHILQAAGLTEPVPAATGLEGHALTLVYDDPIFRERFNYAVWFGRRAQLFAYLDAFIERRGAKHFLLAYAEDAEAMGLWPYEAGYLPHASWAHLDKLLSELEERGTYTLVHLSSAQPRAELETLSDGAARWMDRALLNPQAPYHEDGYRDWFDFLDRSPKVEHFRKLYAVVRSNLQQAGAARGASSAPNGSSASLPATATNATDIFYRQALETFCSHQYEFGCIGVGGRGYWGWENVRATFLYTRLTELAQDPQPRRWIEDLNGDGSDEQLLCDGRQLAMFTAYGGRLIGWFDLREGRQWVGNTLAVPPAPYVSGVSEHPKIAAVRRRWLPETFEADLRPWKEQKTKEAAPTRLGRHLTPDLFAREPGELTVYVTPPAPNGSYQPLPAQTGAFNDWLRLDGGDEAAPDRFLDYRFEGEDVITYLNALFSGLLIEKRVHLIAGGLRVQYTVHNQSDYPHTLRWRLANELAPDYAEMLIGGRDALQPFAYAGEFPAVLNTRTARALALKPSRAWSKPTYTDHLLGLNLALNFALDLPAQDAETFTVELLTVSPGAAPDRDDAPASR